MKLLAVSSLPFKDKPIIWIVLLLSLFVTAVARIPQLFLPFERDEGAYAYIAEIIDRGGLPYRDAFDHKPPGIYYLYHLSFSVFSNTVYAPRLAALFFIAATCILVYSFVFKVTKSSSAGTLSMALLAFATASPAYAGFTANTEIFVLPFVLGASLLLLKDELSGRVAFLCRGASGLHH